MEPAAVKNCLGLSGTTDTVPPVEKIKPTEADTYYDDAQDWGCYFTWAVVFCTLLLFVMTWPWRGCRCTSKRPVKLQEKESPTLVLASAGI